MASEVAQQTKARPFLDLLEQSRPEIAKLLPDPKQVDRIIRVVRSAWQSDEEIRKCDPFTIIAAVMKACELGLEPGGALRHAYLVRYGTVCQLLIGYAGLLSLVRESGNVGSVGCRVVKEKDGFSYHFNPEPTIEHFPTLEEDRGPTTFAYAYLRTKEGELSAEVMTRAEVEHVRANSKSGPVWNKYWDEMARKTVLRRLLKSQELTPKVAAALKHDDETAGAITARVVHVGRPGLTRTEALTEQLSLSGPRQDEAPEPPRQREPGED